MVMDAWTVLCIVQCPYSILPITIHIVVFSFAYYFLLQTTLLSGNVHRHSCVKVTILAYPQHIQFAGLPMKIQFFCFCFHSAKCFLLYEYRIAQNSLWSIFAMLWNFVRLFFILQLRTMEQNIRQFSFHSLDSFLMRIK